MKYFYVFMAIDEQLLNQNNSTESEEDVDEESMAAGDFREEKRATDFEEELDEGKSLRELKQMAMMQQAALDNSETAIGMAGKIPQSAIWIETSNLLKAAWENLIDSFGLTLIWIDIHFFLNRVFGPKVFCRLGEEWVPDNIKKLGGEKAKEASALLTKTEEAGCACLNLGCLFLVIASLSITAMIASAVSSPFQTLYDILFSDGLSGFLDMIKNLW